MEKSNVRNGVVSGQPASGLQARSEIYVKIDGEQPTVREFGSAFQFCGSSAVEGPDAS